MIEHLPNIHKSLGSIPVPQRKCIKQKEKTFDCHFPGVSSDKHSFPCSGDMLP